MAVEIKNAVLSMARWSVRTGTLTDVIAASCTVERQAVGTFFVVPAEHTDRAIPMAQLGNVGGPVRTVSAIASINGITITTRNQAGQPTDPVSPVYLVVFGPPID